jgi:hypothetical protein
MFPFARGQVNSIIPLFDIGKFTSYSHCDKRLFTESHSQHLALRRKDLINAWPDRQIPPTGEIDDLVPKNIDDVEFYFLSIPSDSIQSDDCYECEFAAANDRQSQWPM